MTERALPLKIKIVPLLFGLGDIFFVFRICQQGGSGGVLRLGGKGGGRPDFAMAGAKDASMASKALEAVEGFTAGMIK
mgnify:CR=1 FL=1